MLNIATINVQNKYKEKDYNGRTEQEDHIEMLLELIDCYELDLVGLQEVNPRYKSRLQKHLKKNFSYYGKSRYKINAVTRRIGLLHTFNESVPIITSLKVLKAKTVYLPWIFSYVPRIATILEVETKELGPIVVLNTHLDNRKTRTKAKELVFLAKTIKKMKKPVILMGDFNMTVKNTDFQKFMKEMQKLNIDHVKIEEKTFKEAKSNVAIDHIFLSNCFQVEKLILEKSSKYEHFSDHYPIILKIRLGFSKK